MLLSQRNAGYLVSIYAVNSIYGDAVEGIKDQIELLKEALDECGPEDIERIAKLKDMIRELTLLVAEM